MLKKRWKGSINILFILLIPFLLSVSGCTDKAGDLSNPKAGAFSPTGTIQGQVTDRVTNDPISGAKVSIASASGVQTVVTGSTGLYVIANLPATTDVGGNSGAAGSYTVSVDLTGVNSALPTGSKKYPETVVLGAMAVNFTSLNDCIPGTTAGNPTTTGDQSNTGCNDTQVQGLVSTLNINVGKLAANLTGTVTNKQTGLPENLAKVELLSGGQSNNDSTGTGAGGGNLVATATTGADGRFTIPNIESAQQFRARATSSDGLRNNGPGTGIFSSPPDGQTVDITAPIANGGLNNPIALGPTDNQGPQITLVTPANLTDLPPAGDVNGNTLVKFKFSEPIVETSLNAPLPSTTEPQVFSALGNGLIVNFDGAKAGNIRYTLSWNTAFDELTVTIPSSQLASASRYSVTFPNNLLTNPAIIGDAANNAGGAGFGGIPIRIGSGCAVDTTTRVVPDQYTPGNPCVVNFTTSGTATPSAPTVQLVNESSLNQTAAGIAPILRWNPVSGAIGYRVFRAQTVEGTTGFPVDITPGGTLAATEFQDPTLNAGGLTGFVGNSVFAGGRFFGGAGIVKYDYTVKAVGVNKLSDSSAAKTAADKVAPSLTGVAGLACVATSPGAVPAGTVAGFICDTKGNVTDILLTFGEPLDRSAADDPAVILTNYTLGLGAIPIATATAPTLKSAFYNESPVIVNGAPAGGVRLTLDTATAATNLNQSARNYGPNGASNAGFLAGDDIVISDTGVVTDTGAVVCVTENTANVPPSGDDVDSTPGAAGGVITAGANRVCDTVLTAAQIAAGAVQNSACVTEGASANVAALGDDVDTTPGAAGGVITAGADKVCNTSATAAQIAAGAVQNSANKNFIASGANLVLDSSFIPAIPIAGPAPVGSDDVIIKPAIVTIKNVKDIAGNAIPTTNATNNTLLSSGGVK